MASTKRAIIDASARFPKPDYHFKYGTAGFREKADRLDSVVFRVGLLAALRSKARNGKVIGVMITASHNPPVDNGIKLVDPMGEMLESSWESWATKLANAASDEAVYDIYASLATETGFSLENESNVVFARDTRTSGPRLIEALSAALTATGAHFTDYKLLTTPQLHYVTRCLNTKGTEYDYGEPTEEGYYKKLAEAFKTAMHGKKPVGPVSIDCANGVGGPKLRELVKHLPDAANGGLDIKVVNDDVLSPDSLNYQCGADFVKTQQRAPQSNSKRMMRCCSLDGDADRLMYYFMDENDGFHMLDGDRIATIASLFIGDLVKSVGLQDKLRIGVVQTAYANGASTDYITKKLNLPVECTPTGVKHLHHAAMRFEIGIYFEANGHGTILFSDVALKRMRRWETDEREKQNKTPAQVESFKILKSLTHLINQTVGDALSDMLLVEVILAHKRWSLKEWSLTYEDLPNRLYVVKVKDRNSFTTTDAERQLLTPDGAQDQITALAKKYGGRSFVRPSGTEDVMRVYAEARNSAEMEKLGAQVVEVIKQYGA